MPVSHAVAASETLCVCMCLVRVADNCRVAFNTGSNWAKAVAPIFMPACPAMIASPHSIGIKMAPLLCKQDISSRVMPGGERVYEKLTLPDCFKWQMWRTDS